MPGESHESV